MEFLCVLVSYENIPKIGITKKAIIFSSPPRFVARCSVCGNYKTFFVRACFIMVKYSHDHKSSSSSHKHRHHHDEDNGSKKRHHVSRTQQLVELLLDEITVDIPHHHVKSGKTSTKSVRALAPKQGGLVVLTTDQKAAERASSAVAKMCAGGCFDHGCRRSGVCRHINAVDDGFRRISPNNGFFALDFCEYSTSP